MHRLSSVLVVFLITVFVSGCAGPQMPISITQERRAVIRSVAIVSMPNLPGVSVFPSSAPEIGLLAFGALGGLLSSAITQNRILGLSQPVWEKMQGNGATDLRQYSQQLATQLSALGYETRIIDDGWVTEETGNKLSPNALDSGSDATVVLSPGPMVLIPNGDSGAYHLNQQLTVRIHTRGKSEPAYLGFHVAGIKHPNLHPKFVFAGEVDDSYATYETIVKNPDSITKTLHKAIAILVSSAADVLDPSVTPRDFEATGGSFETDYSNVDDE